MCQHLRPRGTASPRHRIADVARIMKKELRQPSTVRNRLIRKRIIVPSECGYVRYNLPRMRQYFTGPLAFPPVGAEDTWPYE